MKRMVALHQPFHNGEWCATPVKRGGKVKTPGSKEGGRRGGGWERIEMKDLLGSSSIHQTVSTGDATPTLQRLHHHPRHPQPCSPL